MSVIVNSGKKSHVYGHDDDDDEYYVPRKTTRRRHVAQSLAFEDEDDIAMVVGDEEVDNEEDEMREECPSTSTVARDRNSVMVVSATNSPCMEVSSAAAAIATAATAPCVALLKQKLEQSEQEVCPRVHL